MLTIFQDYVYFATINNSIYGIITFHFVSLCESVSHYVDTYGYGQIMTKHEDQLTPSIKSYYLQKKKVDANERTKCAIYCEPNVAVNK